MNLDFTLYAKTDNFCDLYDTGYVKYLLGQIGTRPGRRTQSKPG
jgi:hypothetical protein